MRIPPGHAIEPSATATASPEVLSPRLLEVAVLVAAGLTNEEIGARVWLSTASVANYIRQIRGFLGVSERSEIASWVAGLPAERPSTES